MEAESGLCDIWPSLDGIAWKNTGKGVLATILYLNRT
jgi:hypothetical protein